MRFADFDYPKEVCDAFLKGFEMVVLGVKKEKGWLWIDGSSSNENGRALIRVESKLRGQARSKENADSEGFANFEIQSEGSRFPRDEEKEGRKFVRKVMGLFGFVQNQKYDGGGPSGFGGRLVGLAVAPTLVLDSNI